MSDFKEELTQRIVRASRIAFTTIMKEKPKEKFFAFCLVTLDDALSCYAYANSEESHSRTLKNNDVSSAEDEDYFKWAPEEWEYSAIAREEFDDVYDLSDALQNDKNVCKEFYQYKLDFIECMENTMKLLDQEGIFDQLENRKEFTLFLTVSDSFMAEEIEKKSAKRLNSVEIYEKFLLEKKL